MKKVLSLTLALVMLFATVSATATAYAEYPFSTVEIVKQYKEKAAKYIAENDTTDYTSVQNASGLWTLIKAGQDMSAVKDAFVSNVKANLDTNSGKLVVAGENWYQDQNEQWYSVPYSYEDVAVYGATLLILDSFGYDVEDFEGYDLLATFCDFDLSGISTPYSYRVAVEAANRFNKDAFAASLVEDMETRFYTMGSGVNYWGYSCDNTAQMLLTIGNYDGQADHVDTIGDAKRVIRTYTVSIDEAVFYEGAFCDPDYAPDPNADSTGLALAGFSAVGDVVNAKYYYDCLIDNFYDISTGAFTYLNEYGKETKTPNMAATKDALLGLIYYENAVKTVHDYQIPQVSLPATLGSNGIAIRYCSVCGDSYKEIIPAINTIQLRKTSYTFDGKAKEPEFWVTNAKSLRIEQKNNYDVKYSNNKNVGTATATITFKYLYSGTYTKTFKINPKGTSLTGVTADKKGFTAKWKKQATQTTGYQIQYSTNKNFKNAKTVTVKDNKATSKKVSKLSSKKKYFVRIRTYKTIKGNNYYSSWSKAKTVTTKK